MQNPDTLPDYPHEGTTGKESIHSHALMLNHWCRQLNGDTLRFEDSRNGYRYQRQLAGYIDGHLHAIRDRADKIEELIAAELSVEVALKEGGQ